MNAAFFQPAPPTEPVFGSYRPDAIELGRVVTQGEGVGERIRYAGDQHVVVFGANGKGKGTRFLMPNLLQMHQSSIVVVDPKGELAAVTAPFRATLGPVVILNPFGVLTDLPDYGFMRSHGFNPLAMLDPDARSFNVQAALLAEAMVPIEGREPHFSHAARALIAMLIMQEVTEARAQGRFPTMARVRDLLCQMSGESMTPDDDELGGFGLVRLARELSNSPLSGLRNKASQFTNWTREIQSVASTARTQTESFDDPEIADDMAADTFDFAELKRRPMTVYIILPPDMMLRHAKWLRLVLTSALHSVMRPRRRGEPKVTFFLDEYFALGQMEILSTVWSLTRGYGVQMVPILQSARQLHKLEGDMWENFVGMAGAVLALGASDMFFADWLSKRMGETTRDVVSQSMSTSRTKGGGTTRGDSGSGSTGSNWSQATTENMNMNPTRVPLLTPHRMFGFRDGFGLLALNRAANLVPVYAPPYYDIQSCWARSRDNPYYIDD